MAFCLWCSFGAAAPVGAALPGLIRLDSASAPTPLEDQFLGVQQGVGDAEIRVAATVLCLSTLGDFALQLTPFGGEGGDLLIVAHQQLLLLGTERLRQHPGGDHFLQHPR